MRERCYPLHYREPRRDGPLPVVDCCPFCGLPHYYLPREGGFKRVVRAHCRRNRRRARPELVYRLVPSRVAERARARQRAREVILQLLLPRLV
jgi:hypothetical protein